MKKQPEEKSSPEDHFEATRGSKQGQSSSFSAAKLMASIVQFHLDLKDSLSESEVKELPSSIPQSEGEFRKLKSDPHTFFNALRSLVLIIKQQKEEYQLNARDAADAECSSYESHLQKLECCHHLEDQRLKANPLLPNYLPNHHPL